MKQNRRNFLKQLRNSSLGVSGLLGMQSAFGSLEAQTADLSGYKALVCVFLYGGMDNHDTVIPYDQTNYDAFAKIRSSFMNHYPSRQRSNLLALNPDNTDSFQGRQFALPPQLSGIHGLFESGDAAIVGNVGPLLAPLTKADFDAKSQIIPKRLFSHNDQQSTWMASEPEGAVIGWGGRFADVAMGLSVNATPDFTNIATFNNQLFLNGQNARPYQVSLTGGGKIEVLEGLDEDPNDPFYLKLAQHFNGSRYRGTHVYARDVAAKMSKADELNQRYNQVLSTGSSFASSFPKSHLGLQLQKVAETIASKDQFQMGRQVFFVGIGGFDTHDRQVIDLPKLHTEIDAAVSSFQSTMKSINMDQSVTLFTASDFGRSLVINGDGTDHGWGAHHFVVGGAVKGKQIYGSIPKPELDHEYDSGNGRLIPSVSVEQFAEPLGSWFGLNSSELNQALPNLSSFNTIPTLDFI